MMTRILHLAAGILAGLALLASAAWGGLSLPPENVGWETVSGMVQFHLRFHNDDPVDPSSPATYQVFSQQFGGFVPHVGMISDGTIPPIPPDSFFDVFFEVPLSELPPNPPTQFGVTAGNGRPRELQEPCPPDDHWDGNIDVIWLSEDGTGGQVNFHIGTLQLCPGGGNSYIHLITNCPGNITWGIKGLCAGFTATLVNEDFSPAPAILPAGWTGWICTSADETVPVGTVCCFQVNLTCGGVTTPINLCTTACKCEPTAARRVPWGAVKRIYR